MRVPPSREDQIASGQRRALSVRRTGLRPVFPLSLPARGRPAIDAHRLHDHSQYVSSLARSPRNLAADAAHHHHHRKGESVTLFSERIVSFIGCPRILRLSVTEWHVVPPATRLQRINLYLLVPFTGKLSGDCAPFFSQVLIACAASLFNPFKKSRWRTPSTVLDFRSSRNSWPASTLATTSP